MRVNSFDFCDVSFEQFQRMAEQYSVLCCGPSNSVDSELYSTC